MQGGICAAPLGTECHRSILSDGEAARNPPGAYWVVREEGFRHDNAADGRSWTGFYPISSSPHAPVGGDIRSNAA